MVSYLSLFIIVPLFGFLLSLILPKRQEFLIAGLGLSVTALQTVGAIVFATLWIFNGHETLEIKQITVYKSGNFEFFIDLWFDKVTAAFAITGSAIAFLVVRFSKYYMHRESGYKRYFSILMLFFLGYNLIVFGGNFETLFTGWEIIGLCSFLLISFYRDRYLPARNALKVITVFRMSDVALIAAMWMMHHLWHANITFQRFYIQEEVLEIAGSHSGMFIAMLSLIVIAALIKSAQFPFTYWIPRAMEGPTSSSAIFYGSLSVHIGALVLLRSFPLWQDILWIKIAVIAMGVITALISTSIARVQPTVKTQIAYASAAQLGLIFIEISLGLDWLALFHFTSNAFLRTYQLLVSPSVMNYKIHDQFFTYNAEKSTAAGKVLPPSLYVLAIKEWNMDIFFRKFLWTPFKFAGKFLRLNNLFVAIAVTLILWVTAMFVQLPPEIFAALSLLLILAALSSRDNPLSAWTVLCCAQFALVLGFVVNGNAVLQDLNMYCAGSAIGIFAGYVAILSMPGNGRSISLTEWNGLAYNRSGNAALFLLGGLGMVAFPITTAFVGMDVLLTGIEHDQYAMITLVMLSLLFVELAVLRLYARIFMGQPAAMEQPVAFKAS